VIHGCPNCAPGISVITLTGLVTQLEAEAKALGDSLEEYPPEREREAYTNGKIRALMSARNRLSALLVGVPEPPVAIDRVRAAIQRAKSSLTATEIAQLAEAIDAGGGRPVLNRP
jgi:hypothetical protein